MESLNHGYSIGVDLGGTKLAAGRILQNDVLDGFVKIPTEGQKGPEHVTKQIIQLIDNLVADRRKELKGIGIGVPGSVNWQTGVIHRLTNLAGWDDYPLKKIIEEHFHVPVVVENDANAAAWGEYRLGGGQGCESILYLTISTGIGAGVIVGGKLLRGYTGNAGEVGHMVLKLDGERCRCGNQGCWETLSSGTAIAARAKKLIGEGKTSLISQLADHHSIKAEHVFEAYSRGDELAQLVVDEALSYLGLGVANLVNIINPERVVIGGGVAKAGSLVFTAAGAGIKKLGYAQAALTQVVPAKLKDYAGVIGAASLL